MVLIIMKKLLRTILFLILTVSFSCEEQGWFVKCSDCVAEEPKRVDIKVKLSDLDIPVQVRVYEGELEDNVVYDSAITNGPEVTFSVSLNKLYSFTALYSVYGNIYTAVDSANPKVKYTKDDCDDPCYFIYDKLVDLRLKYKAVGE
jgi:hypothetical protein